MFKFSLAFVRKKCQLHCSEMWHRKKSDDQHLHTFRIAWIIDTASVKQLLKIYRSKKRKFFWYTTIDDNKSKIKDLEKQRGKDERMNNDKTMRERENKKRQWKKREEVEKKELIEQKITWERERQQDYEKYKRMIERESGWE